MNTSFDNALHAITAKLLITFARIVTTANAHPQPAYWEETLAVLRKHGLLESLVPAPFSRLGFSRVALKIDRTRLQDPAHLNEVCGALTVEMINLIRREFDDASAAVVLSLSGDQLMDALANLYLNESTGKGIATYILRRRVDELVDNSVAVAGVMSQVDRRFETIARVTERELGKGFKRLEERSTRAFDELSANLRMQTRLAQLEVEHRDCTQAKLVEKPVCGTCGDGNRKMGRDELVEVNCKRYLMNDQ